MTHDYHEGQPGYSPAQILHDGCAECARRGGDVSLGIASLDPDNFVRAWERAAAWNIWGLDGISEAEAPLLRVLWAIQLQFVSLGVPIGELPSGVTP